MLDDTKALIQRARDGDSEALEKLLIAYAPYLTKCIAARFPKSLSNVTSVEDLVQEALAEAFTKVDRLRDTTSTAFSAWLKAIGQTTILSSIKLHGRKKRGGNFARIQAGTDSQGQLVDLITLLPADAVTASRGLAKSEADAAIRVAVAKLPADQRLAIQLHLLNEQSLEQTAEAMGKSPTAVRGLVYRAKQQLAEAMGRASAWLSSR